MKHDQIFTAVINDFLMLKYFILHLVYRATFVK